MRVGEILGRYEIREKIGEGGMGEVFLAYDARLERFVVLKVLHSKFSEAADLLERFKREAKAVSALNHPNIITIYETIETDGLAIIVYEYIKGETLREKIVRNQLTVSDSIKIVEQIAAGLGAAHEAGIIHRDIKPENIMIRNDGYLKILDFGLAKKRILEGGSEAGRLVETQEGMIMGSVLYMSPEQARGEKMDERTDIWSLGVVLYEMLTGRSPFRGDTVSDSIALVLKSQPTPVNRINANIPTNLESVIKNALQKDRNERYQNIQSFLLALNGLNVPELKPTENATLRYGKPAISDKQNIGTADRLVEETQLVNGAQTNERGRVEVKTDSNKNYFPWIAFAGIAMVLFIVGFLALAGIGGWYYFHRASSDIPFQKTEALRLTKDQVAGKPAISPDGKSIAYLRKKAGKQILTVRQTNNEGEREIFAAHADNILAVSFSPDGEFVNFVREESGLSSVLQVPAIGGEPKILVHDVRTNITYSPDKKRFAYVRIDIQKRLRKVMIYDVDEMEERELINSKDSGFVLFLHLAWSPVEDKLLMQVLDGRPKKPFKYLLGTVDVNASSVQDAVASFRPAEKNGCCAVGSVRWMADGSGIIMLSRKPKDKTVQIYYVSYPAGETFRLTNDASNYSWLDLSEDGKKIVVGTEKVTSSIWEVDLESKESRQVTSESEALDNNADISVDKDGKLFYSSSDLYKGSCSIFYLDPETQKPQQFTLGGCVRGVTFSPDGKYLFTSANLKGKGQHSILRVDSDARNPVQLTKAPDVFDFLPQATFNRKLFFNRMDIDGAFPKLMKVSMDGGESELLYDDKNQVELYPKISPDGKYLVYNEFVKGELVGAVSLKFKVVALEGDVVRETVLEKKINQPTRFAWSNDSTKLIYVDPETKMNIKSISIANEEEETLTNFNLHSIHGPPAFSKNGKKMYVIRTSQIRDLVLIKDVTQITK